MLNRDFKEFAELLDARGVEYLLVGGCALAASGHPRCTVDIDCQVRPTPTNLGRVLAGLHDFGLASLGLIVKLDEFRPVAGGSTRPAAAATPRASTRSIRLSGTPAPSSPPRCC
jgi:hypothetical protein